MSASQDARSVLRELREFVDFLQHLWAALAGLSVLFPLSNTFSRIIPLDRWSNGGGLVYVSPTLASGVTTLACLFLVLWTFGQRHELQASRAWKSLPRRAARSFVLGIGMLSMYLAGHYAVSQDFYFAVLGWESDDLRRMAGDLVLVATYAAFFVSMTRAFLFLGLREYLRGGVESSV